jgi:hypothetical protein
LFRGLSVLLSTGTGGTIRLGGCFTCFLEKGRAVITTSTVNIFNKVNSFFTAGYKIRFAAKEKQKLFFFFLFGN